MSFIDGLKEKVANVLYKNLSQWKQKISNSPATELKAFIVQEFARMETELIEFNQIMLQRAMKKHMITAQSPDLAEKDAQIQQLFSNNLRLLALVHLLMDSSDDGMLPESAPLLNSVEKYAISEKGLEE
jgi:hypothetical protein